MIPVALQEGFIVIDYIDFILYRIEAHPSSYIWPNEMIDDDFRPFKT